MKILESFRKDGFDSHGSEVNETLAFRPASEVDLPFLLDLRKRTMSEHLRNSGVESSENDHSERVLARFECAEIIMLSDRPVGLLKVAREAQNWNLIQIQLVPEQQGKGLGTGVLNALLEDAARSRVFVSLSVLRANPARRLYERLGFRVISESEHACEMQFGP